MDIPESIMVSKRLFDSRFFHVTPNIMNLTGDFLQLLNTTKTSQTTFNSCMHDQMLESNRDDVKLEAMRCVTVMTAKGKLSVPRTLFPHIVKNVSSKNPELKKLIYLYLTNFADQEPDLALLPVATLQKSLKSPNPLVRSSALKVLTSMRLSILSAILMATLRNSVNDLSPYVRKTVAHAIIKIYRLEPGMQADLIEYVERLFNDKNSMVLSSSVAAFEVVCPEKLDLVHKHYRRFCFILSDCNEWGQTLLLKLLTRFVLKTLKDVKSGNTSSYNPSEHDPKILLRSAKPLVHSHSSAVVMAVIKLYIAIANHNEVRSTITRPLIRLLYTHREIQLIVLQMIEDLTKLGDSNYTAVVEEESDNENARSETNSNENDLAEETYKLDLASDYDQEVPNHLVTDQHPVTGDGYIPLDSDNGSPNFTTSVSARVDEDKSNNLANKESDKVQSEEEDDEDEEKDEEEDEDEDEDDSDEKESDEEDESTEEDDEDEDEDEEESEDESDKEPEDTKRQFDLNLDEFDTSNKDPNTFREVFRPYIKSFFIRHNDCTQIRLAKLRILTNLSSSINVSLVLRELQAYIAAYVDDKEFVAAAIHAMGRCAIIVKEVAHTCLNGLTTLLSNNNEHIVSQAIVVLRSQIINKKPATQKATPDDDGAINNEVSKEQDVEEDRFGDDKIVSTVIKQVTKLLPTVTAPQARATILWILAEFCDKNRTAAKCAPNVLRWIAKSFCQEDNFVKLQGLTLASKFLLTLDKEKQADLYCKVHLLTGYIFSLAKYDINHDVRDRGRFLRKLLDDEVICVKVLNNIAA